MANVWQAITILLSVLLTIGTSSGRSIENWHRKHGFELSHVRQVAGGLPNSQGPWRALLEDPGEESEGDKKEDAKSDEETIVSVTDTGGSESGGEKNDGGGSDTKEEKKDSDSGFEAVGGEENEKPEVKESTASQKEKDEEAQREKEQAALEDDKKRVDAVKKEEEEKHFKKEEEMRLKMEAKARKKMEKEMRMSRKSKRDSQEDQASSEGGEGGKQELEEAKSEAVTGDESKEGLQQDESTGGQKEEQSDETLSRAKNEGDVGGEDTAGERQGEGKEDKEDGKEEEDGKPEDEKLVVQPREGEVSEHIEKPADGEETKDKGSKEGNEEKGGPEDSDSETKESEEDKNKGGDAQGKEGGQDEENKEKEGDAQGQEGGQEEEKGEQQGEVVEKEDAMKVGEGKEKAEKEKVGEEKDKDEKDKTGEDKESAKAEEGKEPVPNEEKLETVSTLEEQELREEIEDGMMDPDDSYEDTIVSQLTKARQNFVPAMIGVHNKTLTQIVPHVDGAFRKGKARVEKWRKGIHSRIEPYLGPHVSPILSTTISYGLLLLPVALVALALERVRAILSLQKVLLAVNMYLAAYMFTLLMTCFLLGAEPMRLLQTTSNGSFVALQLIQLLGYLIYLVLQSLNLTFHCRAPVTPLVAMAIAIVQCVVAWGIGINYYLNVFQHAMLDMPPKISAKMYAIYMGMYVVLCLSARLKRTKQEEASLPQGINKSL